MWILWWLFARSSGKFCEYSLDGIELSQAFGTRQPINVNVSPQQVLTTGPEVHVPAAVQRYLLDINLKQGKNLVIRDKRSGRSPTCMWAIIKGIFLPVLYNAACLIERGYYLFENQHQILGIFQTALGGSLYKIYHYQIFLWFKSMPSVMFCLLATAKGWILAETLHTQCIYISVISLFMTVGSWE